MRFSGFASEALIISGAYLFSQNFWVSLGMILVGCISALGRFSQHTSYLSKKEKMMGSFEAVAYSILEIFKSVDVALEKQKFDKSEIH